MQVFEEELDFSAISFNRPGFAGNPRFEPCE